MLKRILSKNICALQGALGSSYNVQAWRSLSHMPSSTHSTKTPRKQETPTIYSPSVSTLHGINGSGMRQQQQMCPEILVSLLSRLSLSPEEAAATVQYTLPSRSPVSQVAILDPLAKVSIPWDCPTAVTEDFIDIPSHQKVDVYIDDPAADLTITKKATNILQKRHRKMKRHQYKKWRKRNRFKLRMQKQRRRKKQKLRWERHLNRFRFAELKPDEGEQYLAKKQEKLHLYLKYLGVDFDDDAVHKMEESKESMKKKKKGTTCVMSPQGTGNITPKPIVPEGARV